MLLDTFSLGFYIEEYLNGLILVKAGEEASFYEKIADACGLLENSREKYRSRIFTESREHHVVSKLIQDIYSDAKSTYERDD